MFSFLIYIYFSDEEYAQYLDKYLTELNSTPLALQPQQIEEDSDPSYIVLTGEQIELMKEEDIERDQQQQQQIEHVLDVSNQISEDVQQYEESFDASKYLVNNNNEEEEIKLNTEQEQKKESSESSDHYYIDAVELGRGGFGVVYKAKETNQMVRSYMFI